MKLKRNRNYKSKTIFQKLNQFCNSVVLKRKRELRLF